VVLAVADTGPGIRREDQSRVFEKFERGHSGGGRVPGLGIGLSLVKSFIELHGGRIELQSEPGKGTTVYCRLPATEALRQAGE
jgi:signal transduction histidine kinase